MTVETLLELSTWENVGKLIVVASGIAAAVLSPLSVFLKIWTEFKNVPVITCRVRNYGFALRPPVQDFELDLFRLQVIIQNSGNKLTSLVDCLLEIDGVEGLSRPSKLTNKLIIKGHGLEGHEIEVPEVTQKPTIIRPGEAVLEDLEFWSMVGKPEKNKYSGKLTLKFLNHKDDVRTIEFGELEII